MLWTLAPGDGDEPVEYAFGDASITTGGTAAGTVPMAPAFAHAVYDPSVPGGQVKLSWANSSNNETNFLIYRYDPVHKWEIIGTTGADETTFTDHPSSLGPYIYEIYSHNAAGQSTTCASTECSAIGGPDVTLHLLKIARDATNQWNKLTPAGKLTFSNTFFANIAANWDIVPLAGDTVTTPHNKGKLPNGTATVTVAGGVYADAIVDYWLYGIFARLAGISELQGEAAIAGWRYIANPYMGNPIGDVSGRILWFEAGYTGLFSGVGSSTVSGAVLPYPAPPVGEDPGPLQWHMGNGILSGSD